MTSPHAHGSGHHHHHDGERCDTRGRHGMLLFGADPIYLSHLPMPACPHNYQFLGEATLDDAGTAALKADRDVSGNGLYTIDPAIFPIAELDPAGDGPIRTELDATVVHGHFERRGKPIARKVRVTIDRVVHFREFAVDATRQEGQELRYLCFGRPGRLFLAHEILGRPSFDQILAARLVPGTVRTQTGHELDEDVSAFGFEVAQRVGVGRDERIDQRLRPGDTVTAFFDLTSSLSGARGFTAKLRVERELYLEINELA